VAIEKNVNQQREDNLNLLTVKSNFIASIAEWHEQMLDAATLGLDHRIHPRCFRLDYYSNIMLWFVPQQYIDFFLKELKNVVYWVAIG
jgi:hypothetical protein